VPWYVCTVNAVGPASDASNTPAPVIYINLTDTSGDFADTWFYAADGIQQQLLDVGIAAITDGKDVEVGANGPLPGNKPFTEVSRIYGLRQPAASPPATLYAKVEKNPMNDFYLSIEGNGFGANETVEVNVGWLVPGFISFGGTLGTPPLLEPPVTTNPDGYFQAAFSGVGLDASGKIIPVGNLCSVPTPPEGQPYLVTQYFTITAYGSTSKKSAGFTVTFTCPRD
jgi:hypothetical protein